MWPLRPRTGPRSMPSIVPPWPPAAPTTAHRACGRNIIRPITAPSFSIRTAIMSKRSATGRRDIFPLAPTGREGRGEGVTSESDFRDAVVVDEGADRFEQIVAFRLELGGLVDDRPPMAPDLPQAQGGIFDREGRAGFGQGLEIGARAGAPVLPGIGTAGHTLP